MDILRFPLVRFTAFFVAGIIWSYYWRPEIDLVLPVATCLVIVLVIVGYFVRGQRIRPAFGLTLYLAAVSCGVITQSAHAYYNQRNHYLSRLHERQPVRFRLTERLKNSVTGTRYFADVTHIGTEAVHGKIQLHFKSTGKFPIGTTLIARAKIIKNKPPLNPAQFDYGKYLNDKSVPAQCYLSDAEYALTGIDKNLAYYADRLRTEIIDALRTNGFREPELQVLHALILGQQQEISRDTIKDYQFAGAVHILSVSGLHVGFVMLFVNFTLQRLPKTRRYNLVRLACILISLWSFAFIAGLAPSVVRSATMFSFVAVGMNLRRSVNTYHTLIVSLFLILLFEPAFIFDVGFQLSYAALFFILWLQPVFAKLWTPKNRIVNYFWEIITVSFAAQVGTLPLSLYYFHQFPALFFITNLIVIPMLSLIMALGIIVMLPAAFGWIIPFLADALEWSIATLNAIIGFIASFERFVLTDIPCNFLVALSGYIAIIGLAMLFKKPTSRRVTWAVCSLAILHAMIVGTKWHYRRSSEFVVFNVLKKSMLVERRGQSVKVYGSSNPSAENFAVARFAKMTDSVVGRHTYWFEGKKILSLNCDMSAVHVKPDIVILSQSPKINLERWLANHRPEIIIADASNFKTDVARWKATCQKQKIPFHYTNEKGFFRLSAN